VKTNIDLLSHPSQFFLELRIFKTAVVEKIKIHILCSVTSLFRKYEIMWENTAGARQAGDDNMAHARFMLDT